MKKLLILGGAMQQIPAIKRAREMGYYTITCDYFPDNLGHAFSDEYHNVSTTDAEGVLSLSRKLGVDGVVAYASDPAALTAAYVTGEIGLPGNPYEAVRILSRKDLFRKFLAKWGFPCPAAQGYGSYQEAIRDIGRFRFPVMVKPVDSSGSKGVVKVYGKDGLADAVKEALLYSRGKRFIIEEFIVKKGYQVSGDGFSVDGKLVFTSYGNELYSRKGIREYVALGEFWPSLLTGWQKEMVDGEIQKIITALGMGTCAYNIEVILDGDGTPYVLELGARNGGSYIPQIIQYATGVDLVDYTIKAAAGESCTGLSMTETVGCWGNYMILSTEEGVFQNIWFDPEFQKENLLEVHCTAKSGDKVHPYQNTSHSLGTILFRAKDIGEMKMITGNPDKYFKVLVK